MRYIKTFLIQTVNNEIVHDFSFGLLEAIRYHKWYYGKDTYNYVLSETTDRPMMNNIQYYPFSDIVPIGTVEFVLEFLRKHYGINNIKPLNIPQQLMKPEYLKRWTKYSSNDTPVFNAGKEPIFVKDNTRIKGWTNIVESSKGYPAGEYLISEYVYIDSEWRAFVSSNKLVGLQCYSGDFTCFPDVDLIEKMIEDFNYQTAYTLDVGMNDRGTFIIEAHDFFSCGLYGFSDYTILPKMFINTWNKLIKS